ncbi:sulfatase-like hydrolase/transferase [Pontibacter sp. G13]|uniref:sulfatase-like hydrolase/transferase n=1 Tax=Pontibacter sp. G13 TaxID=3074898 RepID=UPI00288B3E3D|nr:sulfatase-like hydrolase/transferase [Pontibacter sp. G13]WNJ20426.1 sulfatase-like hydrolase/transferase [Pontibacter sp. G13]
MKSSLFVKSIQVLALTFALSLPSMGQAQQKNVLFIMADDFNHWLNRLGYYPDAQTPNLDNLASKGVLFADAHCSSPVCNPSRNAIWSGLRPSTTGITANGDGYVRDKAGFENVVTMNQYFKQQGYYVYGGGKLYHPGSMGNNETDPNNWSDLYNGPSGSPGGSLYSWSSPSGDGLWKWSAGTFNIADANDTKLAQHMADQISTYNRSEPFFIAAGLFRPHLPWNTHKDFFDMFDPNTLPVPDGYLVNDGNDINYNGNTRYHDAVADGVYKDAIRAYLANMAYADYNVGIILDALDNSPASIKNNTIVVFMGDHGWHLGEKDRMGKSADFEIAHHTTLIIYDPAANGNGGISQKVVSLQDVYPTLIDLCGLPARGDVEGNSLQPLLQNPNSGSWNKPILMTYRNNDIIKTDQWRLIDNGASSQLYDMVNDPYEWTNLYGQSQYNSIVTDLRAKIDSIKLIGTNLVIGSNPSGFVHLENKAHTKFLQCTDGADGTGSGNNVRGIDNNKTGTWTQWSLVDAGGGNFRVENNEFGLWLQCTNQTDPTDGQPNSATDSPTWSVRAVGTNNNGNQTKWKKVDAGNGYFRLENVQFGRWLQMTDLIDVDNANGAGPVQVRAVPNTKTGDWTRWREVTVSARKAAPALQDLKVYPNPTQDHLIIQGLPKIQSIEVLDLKGAVVLTVEAKSKIDVSPLSAGVYILRTEGFESVRFTKQ